MISWLESLPTLRAGIVVVGGFVVLALAIGYLVARFTSREIRTAHNDRAGFILAVIGVIYAVLLAFVAIGVWERFQQAEARSYEEAGALATVYRDAGSFPDGGAVACDRCERTCISVIRRRMAADAARRAIATSRTRCSRRPTATFELCRSARLGSRIFKRRCSPRWTPR